jgi:uncharacterized protein (DUF2141 family)
MNRKISTWPLPATVALIAAAALSANAIAAPEATATAPDSTAAARLDLTATPDSARAAPADSTAAAADAAGTIAVTVTGVRARDGGRLIVALYRGADGWLKLERAFAHRIVPVTADSTTVTFSGVPPDTTYAVTVVQDRNGNGKMDMRIFPYPRPKEGVGVSGNAVRMGPPRYEKARFALAAGAACAARIIMRY